MKLKYVLLGSILLLSATSFSQPEGSRVITFKECINLAITNSPRLKNSLLEQKRLKYQYKETVGQGLPNIGISGSYDDYLNLPTQLIPGEFFGYPGELIPVQFGTNYNINTSLNATQMVYNQTYFTGLQLVKRMMEQNQLQTEQLTIDLMAEVARGYYTAQVIRKQLKNMETILANMDRIYEISQQQFSYGLIKKVDVDRINVNRLNQQTEIDNMMIRYQQQMNMEKYFMGIDLKQEILFTDSIDVSTMAMEAQPNLDKHIDIRMIEKQKQISQTNLEMSRANYYPSLNLAGSVIYTNQSNTFYLFGKSTDWYNTSLLGLRMEVPVFNGFQKRSRVSQDKVRLEQIRVTENDTRQVLARQSADASGKYLNSIKTEQRQRENVVLAMNVYRISQEQYQKGIISLTDILSAEQSLSDAQNSHSLSLVNMKIAELDYLQSTGKLQDILNK
jgi:outer membrane protein